MNTTSASTATAPLPSPDEHEPHEQSPSAKKLKCDGSGTLQCCPLARDAKVFILHALRNHVTTASKNQQEGKHDSNPVDYLSDLWLQDRDIANLALEANLICADELPAVLRNDRTYILEAVCKNPHIWISLPKPMQADPEFIASIPIFPDLLLLHDVFSQYPDMVHQREIWMHALDTVLGPDTGNDEPSPRPQPSRWRRAPDAARPARTRRSSGSRRRARARPGRVADRMAAVPNTTARDHFGRERLAPADSNMSLSFRQSRRCREPYRRPSPRNRNDWMCRRDRKRSPVAGFC